ncbi:MAG TPA: alkaline phosphatase family protein [Chitinophaga sp.]|uniref:alkaline phosphatase family protein n=1 Tax=Chitinophaga sp. TaxID=1869181 RepID=UPI002B799DE0|nr:alkaline phosphatase family protein [Chitinophaga sp.]HVI45127.1 alkaline phosphatase family protein [Chitinophaga sp.]
MKKLFAIITTLAVVSVSSCSDPKDVGPATPYENGYKTKNVVLLVVDGPRISETWEDSTKQHIPNRVRLLKDGVFISNFMNNGTTNTNPGHSALCSGVYEDIANDGTELPGYPSVMQQWLKYTGADKTKAWIVASKDKLEVLNNCKLADWNGKYQPSADCGTDGNGSDYRSDVITMNQVKNVMKRYSPNILVINLKDVDDRGHNKDSIGYINAIKATDKSITELWDYIQALGEYKDKTTLIVSNDHGRHTAGTRRNAYTSHGDACKGCRHIEFFALGPDFKKNTIINTNNYEQIDVASTIAELLQFPLQYAKGKVIKDAFN